MVLKKMGSVWPGFSINILLARGYRWPLGAVHFLPDTIVQQKSMREELDNLDKSVAFADDGLYHASMELSLKTVKASHRVMGRG